MRTLMWFAIGFAAACAAGVYFLADKWLMILMICALLAAVGMFLLKRRIFLICGVVLLGIFIGMGWQWGYDCLYLQPIRLLDGESVATQIVVSDYSYGTTYGIAVDGKILLDGKEYKTRAYLMTKDCLSPGDRIEGNFRLRMTTQDAEQGPTHHQGKGVFLLSYGDKDMSITYENSTSFRYFPAKLRRAITDILDQVFPADVLAFARALLLGDSTLLSYEDDTALKVSGIRHVIAVSGLHVSILFALVYFISGRKRVLTALLGIPVLVMFAAVAGFTPSIMRACIMQVLMILSMVLDKEYDPPTALSAAVLTMLAVNPLTITSVSFQLSVGCLIGILAFYQPLSSFLVKKLGCEKGMTLKPRLLRWTAASVAVTTSAMIVTTPLVAWYFGAVSIVGFLTNLLTLWVISFVFYGIMLVCVLGAIWLPAAKLLAFAVAYPIRYVLLIARILSAIPFSAVYTCSGYIVVWLVFAYILLVVFFLWGKKYPGVFASCMLAGLVLSIVVSCIEPKLDDVRVTVLDVGQGQSILLQAKDKNYLVDCGGDDNDIAADAAAQLLLSQGINCLDGLILTHYDRDHAGGVTALLSRVSVDTLYLPDILDEGNVRSELENRAADKIVWVTENTILNDEHSVLTLVPEAKVKASNESCLCILFQAGNCDILITGDRSVSSERKLLESILLPELELLVVGHHGSDTATGMELLNATMPKTTVISVGKDNTYGHPQDAVLKRLQLFGCKIWRTDLDGTVIFRG